MGRRPAAASRFDRRTRAASYREVGSPGSPLSREWHRVHDLHVTRRLLEMIEPQFEPTTWRAFRRVAIDGISAADAARELGVTINAVFIAKSRVLARLREEAGGLVDT